MNKLIVLAAIVFTSGCASIVSQSSYPLSVNSDPSGAIFTIENLDGEIVETGSTPHIVTLKASSGYFKKETYTITLSKDGFEEEVYTVSSSLDGWYWGNILIGGLIGMLIVDPATGSMYKLPDRIDVSLSNQSVANANQELNLVFATIDSLTDSQRSRLEEIR